MKVEALLRIPASVTSDFSYVRRLLEAGLNAATSVPSDAAKRSTKRERSRAALYVWTSAAIGMAVGASAMYVARKGKFGRNALAGALVGGVCGFGGSLAWGSREVTSKMVHDAAKNIGAVRDDRWLEKHPICYG